VVIDAETVAELTAGMTGRWLVVTQGSNHLWDLDQMTWARFPGPLSLRGSCLADAEDLPIIQIGRYPKVGGLSVVLCCNPHFPEIVHWRQSSLSERIERLGDISEGDALTRIRGA
jgi:hypothetical protein